METRQQKIEALQAIKAGKATIESLQPPQQFTFTEMDQRPGIYVCDGKEYTVDEYLAFCKRIKNSDHTIITVTKHQPSRIKGNLTLNIE